MKIYFEINLTRILYVTLSLFSSSLSYAREIQIGSDRWCPYVCIGDKDKPGFLVEVVNQSMKKSEYKIKPEQMPYKRALTLVLENSLDGIYAPNLDSRLLLSDSMGTSIACFYTTATSKWKYTDLADLKDITLGVIEDYGYDNGEFENYFQELLKKNSHKIELSFGENPSDSLIKKLLLQRIDAFIEHQAVATMLLKKTGKEHEIKNVGCLKKGLPLVIGVSAKKQNAPGFLEAFNKNLKAFKATPNFHQLLEKYSLPLTADESQSHGDPAK